MHISSLPPFQTGRACTKSEATGYFDAFAPACNDDRAFSLIELSIVLVILGLLTGGILAGQSLVRAAEIRNASGEYSRMMTALHTFRDKYMALPGDMPNATQFWGIADGTGKDWACGSTKSTSSTTCDGNGNGRIENSCDAPESIPGECSTWPVYEELRVWQHLANAGLINGQYTGAFESSAPYYSWANTPSSRVSSGAWYISYYQSTSTADRFRAVQGNTLGISSLGDTFAALLTPEEAWSIDTKLDDGMPGTGKVVGFKGYSTTIAPCSSVAGATTTQAQEAAAVYNVQYRSKACWLDFPNAV